MAANIDLATVEWGAMAAVGGAVVFPITLAIAQRFVLHPLGISAHQHVRGTIGGVVVIAGTSIIASEVARSIYSLKDVVSNKKSKVSVVDALTKTLSAPYRQERWLLYGVSGIALFTGLGGRLRAVAPSNIRYPGAFAGTSIPASGPAYATPAQKAILDKIGRHTGCHTCGRRRGPFVGDHQPPNKYVLPLQSQRFYPQCATCSSLQGGSVSADKLLLYKHHSLRPYHMWAPAGVLMSSYLGLER